MSVHPGLRPRFHIRPPRGWINDPSGPIFWSGAYHLFFRRHAEATQGDPPSWGHATSSDLVRWSVLDDALTPTPGGPDAGGCWSGSAVAADGHVYAFYTGVAADRASQAVCAAVSDGDLTVWRKMPAPLIPAAPPGFDPQSFRDPYVMHDGDGWLCVVGAGVRGVRALALLYASTDLLSWEFVGPLYESEMWLTEPVPTGEMWARPQLFPLGDRHVLGVSVAHQDRLRHCSYFLGDFDGRRFMPSAAGRLDFGPDYYAATSMSDPAGRRLIWGWSGEALSDAAQQATGFGGCLTLPREAIEEGTKLSVRPVDEVNRLRSAHLGGYAGELAEIAPVTLAGDASTGFDVKLRLVPLAAERVELDLYAGPYGIERTVVFLDAKAGLVGVDTTTSTLSADARTGVYSAPVALEPGRAVDVRVLGDGSILEIFIDGRAFTVRVYPTRDTSRAVRLRSHGGTARVVQADLWTVSETAVRFAPAVTRS